MENSDKKTQPVQRKEPGKDHGQGRRKGRPIHVKEMFLLLWNKKFLILSFVVVSCVAMGIYTVKTQKLYRAVTRLLIEKETLKLFPDSVLGVDTGTTEYYNTQYRNLRSRTVLQSVIDELALKVTERTGEQRPMGPAELFRKVEVSPIEESRLVDISVIDTKPKQAADIANTLAQKFIEFNVSKKIEERTAAAQKIKQELEKFAQQVKDAQDKFNSFKVANNIVSIDKDQNLLYRDLTAATERTSKLKDERRDAEAVYNSVKDLSLEELKEQPEITNNKNIQLLRADLSTVQRDLEILSGRYGEKHRLIVSAKATVKKIEEQIGKEIEAIREGLKNAWITAQEKENAAVAELDTLNKKFHEFDDIAAQYRNLDMEVQTNKNTYEQLLSQSKRSVVETGVTSAPTEWERGTSNIQVIDRALPPPPGNPFRPKPTLNMALAFFAGLFLGVGAAFFTVYLDDRVKNPDDVTEDLGRALLAEIPIDRRKGASAEGMGTIVYEAPKSAISEGFRRLRTSLEFTTTDGQFPSFLVTSAMPGEGKTTTATNLAIAIAQHGKRVVLVDTDMLRPRIRKAFEIDEKLKGLVSYLTGDCSLEDALVDRSSMAVPKRRSEDKTAELARGELKILPCERSVSQSTMVVGSEKMKDLVEELKKRFDVLIFDSPPCTFSDPLILGRMVTGVLAVVEARKFSRISVARGLARLDDLGEGKVLGVVLNKFDPKKSSGYGYYGYRSYYYYYNRYYDRYYYYYYHDRRQRGFWYRLTHKESSKAAAKGGQNPQPTSPQDAPPKKNA